MKYSYHGWIYFVAIFATVLFVSVAQYGLNAAPWGLVVGIVFGVVVYAKYGRLGKLRMSEKQPAEGRDIPITRSLLVLTQGKHGVPINEEDNIGPPKAKFTVFEDKLAYRTFTKMVTRKYSEIENVGVESSLGAIAVNGVSFKFKGSKPLLVVELFRKDNLIELLGFFEKKGLPLDADAKKLLKSN